MSDFNTDRIFNESPKKVLLREYENLKSSYKESNGEHMKMGALKYKALYENESLSFILENSRYIFSEPLKGYDFYKSVMESTILPFDMIEDEYVKLESYMDTYGSKMSETQKVLYQDLMHMVESKMDTMKHTISLYNNLVMEGEEIHPFYDALYEYQKGNPNAYEEASSIVKEHTNLIDVVNIMLEFPELSSELFHYVETCYVEHAETPEDFRLNTYTANVFGRMMKDPYFIERVNGISNMNLRHLIQGLSGVEDSDLINEATVEESEDADMIYSNPVNSVNRLFEDAYFSESLQEFNDEEKINRLLCEKAIVDTNLAFTVMDEFASDREEDIQRNTVVEQLCIESGNLMNMPKTIMGQIDMLQERSNELDGMIQEIEERYFSSDGGPSSIVAKSVGYSGQDTSMDMKTRKKDESLQPNNYTPVHGKQEPEEDEDDEEKKKEKMTSEEIDELEAKKRQAAKDRQTEKYANIDLDDAEFDSLVSSMHEASGYSEIEKPQKRNIFQRIQNKALDTNIKFKRKLANGKRTGTDAKNAGKAVAKIPMSITDSIKNTVNKWDEMDDNKRKEYIIKPGVRKRYFRALGICIKHYIAFLINPILNIVLFICQHFGRQKDLRIRNELIRELDAEIKVTEEKIEDAKNKGDQQQKYKLMRIKDKLEAEKARVMNNSKIV